MLYDIIILGGGPAGYTAAERAGVAGLNVLLIEKQALGGVCLNEGCIPTKTLLYSAKILDTIRSASKYAVFSNDASFDLAKMMTRKNKIIRKLVAGIKIKMRENNIAIVEGKGFISGKKNDIFSIICNGQTFFAKKLLICTGSLPVIPQIKGLHDVDFWTSKEALSASELPTNLIIIGGGVIGMEFASFFNSLDVKVSVIEMLDEIINGMDKELAAMLRTEYAKRGINFYLHSKVISVSNKDVVFENEEGKQISIQADKILLSVGRKPRTETFGLENLNLEKDAKGNIKVNNYMQTSIPDVYACGDVTGHSLLAHTASREAEVAVNHILGKSDEMSYQAIPAIVYTNPEIAGVGYTEEQLQKKGISYKCLKLPMAFSGRFVAENEGSNGVCKILIDENETIKGVHLLGNPSSEFITVATMAIEAKMNIEQWKRIVFPHPTVHEILKETLYI